jgi:hypothetical protein
MIAGFTAHSIHGILSLPSISFRQPGEMAKGKTRAKGG